MIEHDEELDVWEVQEAYIRKPRRHPGYDEGEEEAE